MKTSHDIILIQGLSCPQRGVFSKPDLQTALGEPHPSAFVRRLKRLEEIGVLRRFVRGWYVAQEFHLPTLSQRLAPARGWVKPLALLGLSQYMRNTSFSLGSHFDAFLEQEVASGRYSTASEVVRTALRLLQDRETRLAALRNALEEGEASGPATDYRVKRIISKAKLPEHK